MRAPNSLTRYIPLAALCAMPVLGAVPAESPYSIPQPPFYGQVRTRTEFDAKAMADTVTKKGLLNSQLRTRLGFVAVPSPSVEIKVEVQDVRYYGTEPEPTPAALNRASATTGNGKGVDLSQGYVAVEQGPFKTALGRQKMTLGAGRFLSTLEWAPYSRAFDGWSFNLNLDPGNLTGIAYLVRDTNATVTKDHELLSGLYYSHQVTPDIVAEAYTFYDQSRLGTIHNADTTQNYDLEYYGERVAGKYGMVSFEEEFIWQAGELTNSKGVGKTSEAFQLATRLGLVMGNYKANLGVDMMSGDDTPADDVYHTYRANYYFAHNLYGWMDYFLANPRYGVIDYRIDGDFGFLPGPTGNPRVTLKPAFHYFTPQAAPTGADDPYGSEINFEAHIAWFPKSNIVLGAGLFIPDNNAYLLPAASQRSPGVPTSVLGKASQKENGMFLYFMPTFNF
jgi:hypothetical protein